MLFYAIFLFFSNGGSGGGLKAAAILLGGTTVGAGGVIGYAAYDPTFRKTVEDNVPYSDEVFNMILGPSEQPGEKLSFKFIFLVIFSPN